MTATEQALIRTIGDEQIAHAVMDAIRNLKIPGLILWAQPEKNIERVQTGDAGPQAAREDAAPEGQEPLRGGKE